MLMPTGQFKIFMYPRVLDMRAGADRLAHLCKEEIGMNPYQGAVFLFFNRDRSRAKIYFYDGTGSCVFSKRLERGRFKVPLVGSGQKCGIVVSNELSLLLEGVDTSKILRPRPWIPKKEIASSNSWCRTDGF
jgi:transposase